MRVVASALAITAVVGCGDGASRAARATTTATATAISPAPAAPASSALASAHPRRPARVREGGALALSARGDALYLADEDHDLVRRLAVPVDGTVAPKDLPLAGHPAAVLALDGFVLVTVRDPGALVVLREVGEALEVASTIPLPGDAWGVAVTPDEAFAVVTSAWTHRVSTVDLARGAVVASVDVGREPRGVVVLPAGSEAGVGASDRAYVTHLTGRAVTRIDGVSTAAPRATSIDLPPAPLNAPHAKAPVQFALDASLAYAPVLSPDGARLFVPRHAIGAYGLESWWGRSTVDVLLTRGDEPLAPRRVQAGGFTPGKKFSFGPAAGYSADGRVVLRQFPPFLQPRAAVYRRSTSTLLVAGEGDSRVAELDARALDPGAMALRVYDVGGDGARPRRGGYWAFSPDEPGKTKCGAPTGLALSADETYAYVYCRSSNDLAIVRLDAYAEGEPFEPSTPIVHLSAREGDADVALGKRLFYDARDGGMSDGLACAGCHPEGRDDAHVWHEASEGPHADMLIGAPIFHDTNGGSDHAVLRGVPRQTPMLAGRVAARGPYGWHAEVPMLEQRIIIGFDLHRWAGGAGLTGALPRATALAAFLRKGLVTPPRERRALTTEERRGHEVFGASETRCAECHAPATDFTDRSAKDVLTPGFPLGYLDDGNRAFKTPSLLFVGGTAPYFHDGRAATLADVVANDKDQMGKTSQLSKADAAALVAYLKTIGLVQEDGAGEAKPIAAPGITRVAPPAIAAAPKPPPDADKTPPPTWPEWHAAAPLAQRRAPKCKVFRVREWVRAHCDLEDYQFAGLAEIVGGGAGVEVSEGRFGAGADVVFPMRRGDARVFEIDHVIDRTRMSSFWDAGAIVMASFREGDAEPTIVLVQDPDL